MSQVLFTPTRDFFSPEFKSHYLVSFTYKLTPANFDLVHCWIEEGLVVFVKATAAQVALSGKGTV